MNEYADITRKDLMEMQVPIHDSIEGDLLNIYEVASFSADHIIIIDKPGKFISDKLLDFWYIKK